MAIVSVIMPVFNAAAALERALRSVAGQSSADWELLAVDDDGSTDASPEILARWSDAEPRIRLLHTPTNSGPAAARNLGLWRARGDWVVYLDADDEFYPDYVENVRRHADKGDVLVFGYDWIHEEAPCGGEEAGGDELRGERRGLSPPLACPQPICNLEKGRPTAGINPAARLARGARGEPAPRREPVVRAWDASRYRDAMFERNLSVPLGIAHRRELAEQVGGFDEALWCQEDWAFWKALARAGADGGAAPQLLDQATSEEYPRVTTIFGDSKYHNHKLNDWLAENRPGWHVEVKMRPEGSKGFTPLRKRWVVERTNAWNGRRRRNSKDYERKTSSSAAMIPISNIHVMLRRLVTSKTSPFNYRSIAA